MVPHTLGLAPADVNHMSARDRAFVDLILTKRFDDDEQKIASPAGGRSLFRAGESARVEWRSSA
jgi:hypothetical protein